MTTQNLYALTDLWNSAGTTFTGIGLSVTDTASASGSLLIDLQVGGASRFSVTKAGSVLTASNITTSGNLVMNSGSGSVVFGAGGTVIFSEFVLARDAADTLAQRNGTNAQAFRAYLTYTDASNGEWGLFDAGKQTANVLSIGTNKNGTGATRAVQFVVGGTSIANFATTGHLLWNTDNTYDIGASNATRPRNVFVAGRANIGSLTIGRGGATAVAENTALGFEVLNSASLTGAYNTGVGFQALRATNAGANNTAMGVQALLSNTTGNDNSTVGQSSLLSNTTGSNNSAVGQQALLYNTTGGNNSALGAIVLLSNTTGSDNNAVGRSALRENTTGSNSSAHGSEALRRFVSTGNQVAVGYRALYGGDATPANNTGANNIAIGFQAGDAITTGSTNLVIGYDIDVDSATASNQINIADRYFHDRIRLLERTSDPAKPAEGNMVVWLSDGTGLGDDGDVIISSTAGGVTNYAILFDHSAGTLWP
jgi:hypothetical protein